ncbi:MAG: hypothetical protein UY36_C0001G0029 [Parcubacteria group bacterium GW2011_GWA1_49_11]|nr:MAG: hypothetical protein UY36_C0001G0029 [Parcubacteria group bacterium GW2011_GWA1_49_11]
METPESRKTYGAYLRELRESMGLDRDQMSLRIGVSCTTIRNCENGVQSLGRAAKLAVETLADGSARFRDMTAVAGCAPGYDARPQGAPHQDIAKVVAKVMSTPNLEEKAAAVMAALGVPREKAIEIVVRATLEQQG